MDDIELLLKRAAEMLRQESPRMDRQELVAFVRTFLHRREAFLDINRRHGSPLYIIDEQALLDRAGQFGDAFRREIPGIRLFYALKSNHHPAIASRLVGTGMGLDVSSGVELTTALAIADAMIIFSGPGKLPSELALAVAHADRVTVLIDSFGELARLEQAAGDAGVIIQAGVRLTIDERGLWRKFGIPLADLERFLTEAAVCRHVAVKGLQFHSSWNMNPDNQIAFITRVGAALQALPKKKRARISFVDIGGGYWPMAGEWLQAAGTPEGRLRQMIAPETAATGVSYRYVSTPIEIFARRLGETVKSELLSRVDCTIYTEPGRWLCHDAMHILLTVIDKKGDDLVITDGATNAIGWERFETDYFPVINLSRPDEQERPGLVLGSLCTPHDVWGYGYYGSDIQPGDVLLIPAQGAYTYSLRQNFIKPLPETVVMPSVRPDGS
ncbi:MAG: alanine racemase [candidate division Zixibacteria bacterium]|nr:alanine racemase [candidate division Zixibacteria bacterium]